jgi:hypothetical protein
MRIKGSELRKIIKEEISRMNESSSEGPIRVAYTVGVKSRDPDAQEEEAFEAAVERAEKEHPGYDWELHSGFKGDTGMRISRSPYEGDRYGTYDFIVYLVGHPSTPDPDLMSGGEQYVAAMEDEPFEDEPYGTYEDEF